MKLGLILKGTGLVIAKRKTPKTQHPDLLLDMIWAASLGAV